MGHEAWKCLSSNCYLKATRDYQYSVLLDLARYAVCKQSLYHLVKRYIFHTVIRTKWKDFNCILLYSYGLAPSSFTFELHTKFLASFDWMTTYCTLISCRLTFAIVLKVQARSLSHGFLLTSWKRFLHFTKGFLVNICSWSEILGAVRAVMYSEVGNIWMFRITTGFEGWHG